MPSYHIPWVTTLTMGLPLLTMGIVERQPLQQDVKHPKKIFTPKEQIRVPTGFNFIFTRKCFSKHKMFFLTGRKFSKTKEFTFFCQTSAEARHRHRHLKLFRCVARSEFECSKKKIIIIIKNGTRTRWGAQVWRTTSTAHIKDRQGISEKWKVCAPRTTVGRSSVGR